MRVALRTRSRKPRLWVEQLEDRILLTAPLNDFAQFSGTLANAADTARIPVVLSPADFAIPSGKAVLGLRVEAAPGSTLAPAATVITTAAGSSVAPLSTSTNLVNQGQSLTLASLAYGSYVVSVAGAGGTAGAFLLHVYVAGDANGDHRIDVTDGTTIHSLIGVTSADPRYLTAADANFDGFISSIDYTLWRNNLSVATPIAPLTLSLQTPPGLVTLPSGALATNTAAVTLHGTTEPGASVVLGSASTTADSMGNFSFNVTLASGTNNLQVLASDAFGQHQTAGLAILLDTQAPTVTVSSPAPGLTTHANITIGGQVADNLSGVASLKASVDGAPYTPLPFDALGNFNDVTTLALNGSADGSHTVAFVATDTVGNVSSPVNYTFTLDTVAPLIVLSSPPANLVTNQNFTVAGHVTDDRSGVASLQAALDGNTLAPVTLGTGGTFSFPTNLALDHSADGQHAEHLKATDNAGNVSFFDVFFTLDTVAPQIAVSSPPANLVTNQNFTIAGQVTDDRSGVASLQAALDGNTLAPVTLGTGGTFSFPTNFALNHSADGQHAEHFKATDNAGNISFFDVFFTLDTVAPQIAVSSPPANLVTNQNFTIAGHVTDDRSGVASLQAALDGNTLAPVTLGTGGTFSFPTNLALNHSADGQHAEHLKATDNAGNVSFFDVFFTLDTVAPQIAVTSPPANLVTNQNFTVAGQVTDDRSGVASLQAALDGNTLAPVTLGTGGTFSFPTNLALDHSADGQHAEHLKATDNAGNVSFFDVFFTLDTVAPQIAVSSPPTNLVTNQNFTIAGHVTDDRSGVASLQAALDGNTLAPVTLGTGGTFSFPTNLALNHSADGQHAEHLKATDKAGNVSSFFDVFVTLDTTPPVITVTSPTQGQTVNQNVTVTGQATDVLSGVASVMAALDGGTLAPLSLDAGGHFSLTTNLALDGSADGQHTVHLQVTDLAGNVSTSDVTFTLQTGSVLPTGYLLQTGTTFEATHEQQITIPRQPSLLTFNYANLSFAPSSQGQVQDAFEVALVDASGNSLVPTIAADRDAFFNNTAEQPAAAGAWATTSGQTVTLDVSNVTPGTAATLIYRLVNNNAATNNSVEVYNAQVAPLTGQPAGPGGQPANTAASPAATIDFSQMGDVSASFQPVYGRTSFDEGTNVLYADLAVQNVGTYPVDAPLVLAIDHLSDPNVRVRGADGVTPDGLPYYDYSKFLSGGTLTAGEMTGTQTVSFYNPDGGQFTYDLVFLGELNQPPVFTSSPNLEALVGKAYTYAAQATDPDGHTLTYSLVTAPAGMTINGQTGVISWAPQVGDVGNQSVSVRADDANGGTAQQKYTLGVIQPPPDRPPVFTSTPVVDANVNTAYAYQATATDADQDPLTFALTSGPQGMTVDGATGLVNWQPTADQLAGATTANPGQQLVTLQVSDGRGGSAIQTYTIEVHQQPGNQPPLITSNPVTQYNIPPASNPPSGPVNPTGLQLTLGAGQTSTQTVSLAVGLPGAQRQQGVFNVGDVFFADAYNSKVVQFDNNLNLINDLPVNTYQPSGLAFDSAGNLDVGEWQFGGGTQVFRFDDTGTPNPAGTFAQADSAGIQSITADMAGDIYVGSTNSPEVTEVSPTGTVLDHFTVAIDARGVCFLDLSSDQRTLYYTSEGISIHRYDVVDHAQLPDFASVPEAILASAPNANLGDLRLLPDGGLLVSSNRTNQVLRLDRNGNLVQTYSVYLPNP